MLDRVRVWIKERGRVVACTTSLALVAGLAAASPPSMPAITLPINGASVVTAVVTIAVTILLLVAAAVIGLRLARKLIARISKAA